MMWLLANWKLVVIGAVILGWSYTVYSQGEAHIQAKWDEAISLAKREQQASHDRLQAIADQKASEYEVNAAIKRKTILTLNKRLKDEIAQNNALRGCVADGEFLRLYDAIAGIGEGAR